MKMNRIIFSIGLCIGLISFYTEYIWIKHHYRSFVIVASKCSKPTIIEHRREIHRIFTWFKTANEPSFVPVTCETIEIHTDPRALFLLMKFSSLIIVIWPLVNLIRFRTQIIRSSTKSIGDGFSSDIVKESIGLRTKITVVEKHR